MINFPSYHEEVVIRFNNDKKAITINNAKITVTGNFLVVTLAPTRNEDKHVKFEISSLFSMNEVEGFDTTTKYYPEMGLDNKGQLNG